MVKDSRLTDEKWLPEKKSWASNVITNKVSYEKKVTTEIHKIITSDYCSFHDMDEEDIEWIGGSEDPPFDVKPFMKSLPYNFVFDIGFHTRPLLSGYSRGDTSNDCYCPCSKSMKTWRTQFPTNMDENNACHTGKFQPHALLDHLKKKMIGESDVAYCHKGIAYYLAKLHIESITSIKANHIQKDDPQIISKLKHTLEDINTDIHAEYFQALPPDTQQNPSPSVNHTENQCDTQQKSDIDDSSPTSKSLESSPSPERLKNSTTNQNDKQLLVNHTENQSDTQHNNKYSPMMKSLESSPPPDFLKNQTSSNEHDTSIQQGNNQPKISPVIVTVTQDDINDHFDRYSSHTSENNSSDDEYHSSDYQSSTEHQPTIELTNPEQTSLKNKETSLEVVYSNLTCLFPNFFNVNQNKTKSTPKTSQQRKTVYNTSGNNRKCLLCLYSLSHGVNFEKNWDI